MVAAGRKSSEDSRGALETLCQTYWVPLYGYVRRRVSDVSEAHDLTQAFFAELLEKNYVATADPDRGRFRAFLLTSFRNFLAKQWNKNRALKRGGGHHPVSFDFNQIDSGAGNEPVTNLTAEQIYDRDWALTLLQRIMDRLRQEFESADRGHQFDELKPFLAGTPPGLTWEAVAKRLEVSEAAAKMAGSRMRRRYRELVREEISQTVSSPQEVDDEIHKLFAALDL